MVQLDIISAIEGSWINMDGPLTALKGSWFKVDGPLTGMGGSWFIIEEECSTFMDFRAGMSNIFLPFVPRLFNNQGKMFIIFCQTFKERYSLSKIPGKPSDIHSGLRHGVSNILTRTFNI
ncbi:MAG: hypothetical protein CW346_20035 [Bacillaceae bacterium]|nr:hypothetical protein [Bacillaceae bacterium]